jgi:hypothetical protein
MGARQQSEQSVWCRRKGSTPVAARKQYRVSTAEEFAGDRVGDADVEDRLV